MVAAVIDDSRGEVSGDVSGERHVVDNFGYRVLAEIRVDLIGGLFVIGLEQKLRVKCILILFLGYVAELEHLRQNDTLSSQGVTSSGLS